jgi:hypothetical protein
LLHKEADCSAKKFCAAPAPGSNLLPEKPQQVGLEAASQSVALKGCRIEAPNAATATVLRHSFVDAASQNRLKPATIAASAPERTNPIAAGNSYQMRL